jgi:hypothetical protein
MGMIGGDDGILPVWECEPFPEVLVIEIPPVQNRNIRRSTTGSWEDDVPFDGFSDIPDSTESPESDPPIQQSPVKVTERVTAQVTQKPTPVNPAGAGSVCCLLI